jgi:hypothetical protein
MSNTTTPTIVQVTEDKMFVNGKVHFTSSAPVSLVIEHLGAFEIHHLLYDEKRLSLNGWGQELIQYLKTRVRPFTPRKERKWTYGRIEKEGIYYISPNSEIDMPTQYCTMIIDREIIEEDPDRDACWHCLITEDITPPKSPGKWRDAEFEDVPKRMKARFSRTFLGKTEKWTYGTLVGVIFNDDSTWKWSKKEGNGWYNICQVFDEE